MDPIALWIGYEITDASNRLAIIQARVYRLRRSPFAFLLRKRLMAISDDINAVSDTLDNLATQGPPAITAAIAAAQASGGDPNAGAAVTRLQASAKAAVAAIQGAVPAA